MVTGSKVEAFQGVEAIGNMAPKTLWRLSSQKKPTIDRKEGKNYDSDNPFLKSESGICSLCISAVSAAKEQILFRYFQTFFLIFFVTLSNYGIVQERSFQGERLITINSCQALHLP